MSVLAIRVVRTLLGVLVAMLWVVGPMVHGHAPVTTESAVGLTAHAADTDHDDGDVKVSHGTPEGHEHLSLSSAAVDLPMPSAVALPAAATVAIPSDISATAVDRGSRAPPDPTPTLLHDLLRI